MKKKIIITNVLLSMTVLFSILFQSIHAYEHHSEQFASKKCQHDDSKSKTELTQGHPIFEKCFTCDFSFSSFTTNDLYVFQCHKDSAVKAFSPFFSHQLSAFFVGSLFSLRAPPIF